jgi:tetratricopeptide (TPR) repeat protein
LTNNKQEAKQILINLLQQYPYFYNAQQYLKEIIQELQQEQQDQSMTEVRKLISQTKYNEALSLLQKMVQKDNQYLEAHQTIGEIYLQLHNPSQALVHFQTILKQNPSYLLAQTKKIIAISQLGDWKTAYQLLNPLLKQYQDHYAVREALWEVDQRSQQQIYKELAENFQYESLKQLVEVFIRQEQGQNAINLMLQYENKIDTQNKTNWTNLISQLYFDEGRALMQNEKVAKGLQYIETSLKYTPEAFEPQFFLATIALKQKKWTKALQCFQTLQKQYPLDIRGSQGIALIELGQGLQGQLQGDYDKAIEKFSQYIEKTPDDAEKATIQKRINNLQKTKNRLSKNKVNESSEK